MANNEQKLDLEYFEYVLLNQLLFNKDNHDVIVAGLDYLEDKLFKNITIGKIFGVVKNYYHDNNHLPNWTEIKTRVVDEKTKKSIVNILKTIKEMDIEYSNKELVRNLEIFVKQRLLVSVIDNIIDERGEGQLIDEDKAYAEMNRIQGIALIDNLGLEYFNEKDFNKIIENLGEAEQYISTGYPELDAFLGGGFFKEGKSLYTFGGETNVGKSIVVANLGINLIQQNLNVVIISLEMSEFRYAKRISGMLSNIAISELSKNTDRLREFVVEFKNDKRDSRLFIKEFPTKSITAKSINSYLLKLQRQKNFIPHLIVLDYHTLLKPSIPQGSKHADLQFITQETRALSYLWGAPILSPLQLNRSGSGTSSAPELSTVSGSWDMLSDVDCHINIWQAEGDRESNILRYSIKKARDGAKNDEGFWKIDYNTLRLYSGSEANIKQSEDDSLDELTNFSDLLSDD